MQPHSDAEQMTPVEPPSLFGHGATLAIGTVNPTAERTAPRVRCGQSQSWGQRVNGLFTCMSPGQRARRGEPA